MNLWLEAPVGRCRDNFAAQRRVRVEQTEVVVHRIPNRLLLYVLCWVAPLFCLACSTAPTARPTALVSTDSADSTLANWVTAWNAGERERVALGFEASRRDQVTSAPEFARRWGAWQALEATVSQQCHPRGDAWKLAVIRYTDRRSGAEIEEIHWMHLQSGQWFMYSL